MAKSLRSNKKQQNKVTKRQTVFGDAAAAREKRIAERLHKAAIDDILAKQESTSKPADSMDIEPESALSNASQEAAAATQSKKVSTGGWGKRRKVRGKKGKKGKK